MGTWLDDHMGVSLMLVLTAAAGIIVGVVVVAVYGMFPGAEAEIEAVRSAVERIGPGDNEDVLGQAVEMNRRIFSHRRYNRIWWAGWMVPDGWDEIDPIVLPEGAR